MSGRPWGWTKPGTGRWKMRYDTLRREGFVHEEAARLATGIIGSLAMRRGRTVRRKWLKEALSRGIRTKSELEEAVDDMYDTYDWYDPWSQFYPE
jgi:hypothetical protein